MAQHAPGTADPQSAIWECLNITSEYGSLNVWRRGIDDDDSNPCPDPDLIGVEDLTGIEVFKKRTSGNSSVMESTPLNSDSVGPWLQKVGDANATEKPTMRVLLANQVLQNDQLHPPVSRACTNISKTLLAQTFHLSTVAVEQLGQEVAYSAQCPLLPHLSPSLTCHAVVCGPCSVLWSHDSSSGTTNAFMVMRGSRVVDLLSSRICKTLETLNQFCGLPGLMPFVLLDSTLDLFRPIIYSDERKSVYNEVHIYRGLTQLEPMQAFRQVYDRVNNSYEFLKHADTVLLLSQRESLSTLHRPQHTSNTEWDHMQQHHASLQQAIKFRSEELISLTAHVRYLKDRSAALLTTTMSLMSFNDSKVMLEIAEATKKDGSTMKEIAEATKKDSTSMKVLALITIIFLPSTALSAILAIPDMFDFSSGASIVNSRFWMFWAIAVPLTLGTMMCTWCWLKWETLGRRMWWTKRKVEVCAGEKIV